MSITSEKKQQLIDEFATKPGDTGAPFVQVAILTQRMKNLTDHMNLHKKAFHSRRGLLMMVGARRRLLNYIKRKDLSNYQEIIKKLNIRR
jgi:small subunit ribosomal protein S15